MNTFDYPIPAKHFLKSGGNIIKSEILSSDDITSETFKVITQDNHILNVESKKTGIKSRIHLDMCWVIGKVLIA
jgi:hypothetical protein